MKNRTFNLALVAVELVFIVIGLLYIADFVFERLAP